MRAQKAIDIADEIFMALHEGGIRYDGRSGVAAMWRGSLGGLAANQPSETVSALRDFTAQENERQPDYLLDREAA